MYSPEMSNFLNNIDNEERESLRIQREIYLSNANGCYDEGQLPCPDDDRDYDDLG